MFKPYEVAGGEPGGSGCCRVILNDDGGDGRLVVCFAAVDAPELQALDENFYPSAILHPDGRVEDPRLGQFRDIATWAYCQRREEPARRRRWEARAGSRGPQLMIKHPPGALMGYETAVAAARRS